MIGAQAGLDVLMKQGAVVLACNNALRGVAFMLRRKETSLSADAAMAEVRKSVLPGVYVMPNGIFAVSAAQDAGCHYMRVLV
jgi:intracellular sulfur oxidation DsrE/DsrF family protein